jgi:hypothetical protein
LRSLDYISAAALRVAIGVHSEAYQAMEECWISTGFSECPVA